MDSTIGLKERILSIQAELKAPKNQFNSFGKYKYRSTEDVLEALKPLLKKYEVSMTISDQTEVIGDVPVINTTVTCYHKEESLQVNAQAGVDIKKKGMDISQTFGAASSYARKYALNGMFLIDDSRDADATNDHKDNQRTPATNEQIEAMVKAINNGKKDSVEKALEKYSNITMDKLVLMARISK